ncbi:MAG: hypothetical protein ACQCN3_00165 [Candidatus Bathyarchaeia archaeon]|jgi:hypothetical protein
MKSFRRNSKGQFTIIAAVLVTVILVAAVVSTYSAIRYNPLQEQPQVLSSIDEINLALKQVLGFTVGYYGSVLQVTGNTTYARQLATSYLQSGLVNIGDVRPEWAPSFNITTLDLRANWYSNNSYSSGNLSVTYDLPGIGIFGVVYSISSRLDVQIEPSPANQACLTITKDALEPLVDISKENMKFYRYISTDLTWEQVSPDSAPVIYANGTYYIDLPSGVSADSYLVKVEDSRGIAVLASSYTSYTGTLLRNSTYTGPDYVDATSNIDGVDDVGFHNPAGFTAQQQAPDSVYDTLTEQDSGHGYTNKTLNSESFENYQTDWSETGHWDRVYGVAYSGVYSMKFSGGNKYTGELTSPAVDCSDCSEGDCIVIDFYYKDVGCESGELLLQYNDGSGWQTKPKRDLSSTSETGWIHYHEELDNSQFFSSHFQIRIVASTKNDKTSDDAYFDLFTISKTVDGTSYQLNLEEQWTNVNYANNDQDLCIKAGALGSETLNIDVWHNNAWVNIGSLTGLVNGWKNISVLSYIDSSTFTIRFRDASSASDATLDTWKIDAVLLAQKPDIAFLLSQQESSIIVEWLQNGTMRWLGQNLDLTTNAQPLPPIPVKDLHLNQTINGVNQEVPFQIEDWASNYRIPLGLTSNATVFGNKQMIVFQLDSTVTDFTLWWTGSDDSVQTSKAYTNTYFKDSGNTLNNGVQKLQFSTNGFTLTSTVGSVSTTAYLMRLNQELDTTESEISYVIFNGIVRDLILGEAENGDGFYNSPNVYTNIVISLPANVNYYTYQLRLMFVESSQSRTLSDVCPIEISTNAPSVTPWTENGVTDGYPIITNGTGTFSSSSGSAIHRWSQLISSDGKKGSGIMFTSSANQKLYVFDALPSSNSKGAIRANSNSIELMPVSQASVSFTSSLDVTWSGAVVTFDNTTPVCKMFDSETPTGLWILVEYPPTITVTTQ